MEIFHSSSATVSWYIGMPASIAGPLLGIRDVIYTEMYRQWQFWGSICSV